MPNRLELHSSHTRCTCISVRAARINRYRLQILFTAVHTGLLLAFRLNTLLWVPKGCYYLSLGAVKSSSESGPWVNLNDCLAHVVARVASASLRSLPRLRLSTPRGNHITRGKEVWSQRDVSPNAGNLLTCEEQ